MQIEQCNFQSWLDKEIDAFFILASLHLLPLLLLLLCIKHYYICKKEARFMLSCELCQYSSHILSCSPKLTWWAPHQGDLLMPHPHTPLCWPARHNTETDPLKWTHWAISCVVNRQDDLATSYRIATNMVQTVL